MRLDDLDATRCQSGACAREQVATLSRFGVHDERGAFRKLFHWHPNAASG
jgi:hypothetical protein